MNKYSAEFNDPAALFKTNMNDEILVAPCSFKLVKADFEKNQGRPLPHNADGDKESELFNKDDVMVIVGKKDYRIDQASLSNPITQDEVQEKLNQNHEDLDLENPQHLDLLRKAAINDPKNQFIIKRAMSYYYSRSIKPKTVLPFSVPKVTLMQSLTMLGYIVGFELLNTTTGKKGWISFVDFNLLKKDIDSAKLGE
jgi:hypothetical protein